MFYIDYVLIVNKIRFIVFKKKTIKLLFILSNNDENDNLLKLSMFYMSNSSTNLLSILTFEKQRIYWNIENHIFKHQNQIIDYASLQNNELYVFQLQSR